MEKVVGPPSFFKITTKDDTAMIQAKSKEETFAKYFKEVIDAKISISKIGNILMLTDEKGNEYPIRTLPILWLMGYVSDEDAIATLISLDIATSRNEARKLLAKTAQQDRWISEAIDNLKLEEIMKECASR